RSLPNVCLAPGEPVSTSFHALNFNNFFGGEPVCLGMEFCRGHHRDGRLDMKWWEWMWDLG
ncbi:MAG: hypothetical protein KJ749_01940, partial [Planctomycetes bacterium]|nr:hypothetical protein [Planctomycetota bacterium]